MSSWKVSPIFLQDLMKKNFITDIYNPLTIHYHNINGSLFKCGALNCLACKINTPIYRTILLDIILIGCKNGRWWVDKDYVLWINDSEYEHMKKQGTGVYSTLQISPYLLKKFFRSIPHNKEKKAKEMKGYETLNRIIKNKSIYD